MTFTCPWRFVPLWLNFTLNPKLLRVPRSPEIVPLELLSTRYPPPVMKLVNGFETVTTASSEESSRKQLPPTMMPTVYWALAALPSDADQLHVAVAGF